MRKASIDKARPASRLAIVAVAATLLVTTLAPVAQAAPSDRKDARLVTTPKVKVDPAVLPAIMNPDKTVKVMVELADDPVAVVQAKQGGKITAAQKKQVTDKIRAKQASVASKVRAKGGRVNTQMQSAYNGMQVQVKSTDVAAIAADPNVKAVHPVSTFTIENATSVPFTGAPQVWQDTGYTGENIKVAIIDTGIDYTHADFGGPGTVEAFTQATASDTPNPAWFGPDAARVKGGYDFVGDEYNANDPTSVPKPDANPIDCEGHGTHVAGTAAGGGVKADGTSFTGPYDATTPSLDFTVGPGMAPQADLYALKVFGCDGSTELTAEAIDWAVANDMDVINMSLGSNYGHPDDPSAVAASNAVAAGVVVVASAGNAGASPYLAGSPAAGPGVITVAALDSTKTFPGADLAFGDTKIAAINANGATLPAGAFKIVVLKDDPATPENEALGCSKEAFTKAGITNDPAAAPVIAVTQRGTCARVARAVFGQDAGADAVIMINTASDYPPFEGEILGNPDDGTPYQVTIPFLGVRGVLGPAPTDDGDALVGADGQQLTMGATEINNPGFSALASFSSNGPVSGTSDLRPTVAAPGVSIVSAGVGTGNGADINSGTSMAAPHVAGAAALVRQAHPTWAAWQISDAIATTADPSVVKNYRVTRSGSGALDVAQAVKTQTTVSGERVFTDAGNYQEATLSFGVQEFPVSYGANKNVTITNHSDTAQTYQMSVEAAPGSKKTSLNVFPSQIQVPAGSSRKVKLSVWAEAKAMGTSIQNDGTQAKFNQISGSVVATTSGGEQLRVPYLIVPRASSKVTRYGPSVKKSQSGNQKVMLTNFSTQVRAWGDVYTWGISDARRDAGESGSRRGYDVRAVGAQSFVRESDATIVFAVNMWSRFSNAGELEIDVLIDTNNDRIPDRAVFSYDQGAITTGFPNGVVGVFVVDLQDGRVVPGTLRSSGYLAVAPTDSSTVLLPVEARDLGLRPLRGEFTYSVATFAGDGATGDRTYYGQYDPWVKPFSDGQYVQVPANQARQFAVQVDPREWSRFRPLGLMVVVLDNASGPGEAILMKAR